MIVFTLVALNYVYRHVVNNSAIAVWIIYSVLNSKLTTIRNVDDEPKYVRICEISFLGTHTHTHIHTTYTHTMSPDSIHMQVLKYILK